MSDIHPNEPEGYTIGDDNARQNKFMQEWGDNPDRRKNDPENPARELAFQQFMETLRKTLEALPPDKMLVIYSPSEESAKEMMTRFLEYWPAGGQVIDSYFVEGRKDGDRWVTQLAPKRSTESESI
jgi:hypothetical protein